MKKIAIFLFVSILSFGCTSEKEIKKDDTYVTEYLERLENSKKYTLLVADMMPEENYDFRATPESMSFAENLLHIGYAMDWHSQSLLGGREARVWQTDTVFKTVGQSKAQMIKLIDDTYDKTIALITSYDVNKLSERLDYFGANRTKRQILMLLSDHITHHRGQMLVSLRLKGINPPRYVLYQ